MRDKGHDDVGSEAIQGWRERVANCFTCTTEITRSTGRDTRTHVVHTHLEGDFPGGVVDLEQRFTVTDGLISDLVI